MKSSAKKRRTDHGAAWSDESEASVLFFKQGEANAEADVAAYQRELTETAQRRRHRWLAVTAVLVACAVAVAVALYLVSS